MSNPIRAPWNGRTCMDGGRHPNNRDPLMVPEPPLTYNLTRPASIEYAVILPAGTVIARFWVADDEAAHAAWAKAWNRAGSLFKIVSPDSLSSQGKAA